MTAAASAPECVADLDWPVAPRLLENSHTVADADAVVGVRLLISLLKHADRVRAAGLAQLVNVIVPIMTEPGGPAWRQRAFPLAVTSRLARGTVLDARLTSPTYRTQAHGEVPMVDVVVTHDPQNGAIAAFLVNRSTDGPVTVDLDLSRTQVAAVGEFLTLADPDVTVRDALGDSERVGLRENVSARLVGGVSRADSCSCTTTTEVLVVQLLRGDRLGRER